MGMPIEILFDFGAVPLIGDRATDLDIRTNWVFTDRDETWNISVRRGVLNARKGAVTDATLTISGPKAALVAVILQPATGARLAAAGQVNLNGDADVLNTVAAVMDDFELDFPIVTP
jgi:alkyl sulfatase BDS1-like metallo-beta-lactamase superfamily hydrolase